MGRRHDSLPSINTSQSRGDSTSLLPSSLKQQSAPNALKAKLKVKKDHIQRNSKIKGLEPLNKFSSKEVIMKSIIRDDYGLDEDSGLEDSDDLDGFKKQAKHYLNKHVKTMFDPGYTGRNKSRQTIEEYKSGICKSPQIFLIFIVYKTEVNTFFSKTTKRIDLI
jgi:hypothetical protein